MNKLILFLLPCLFVCSLYGQTALSFDEAEKQGITTKYLDNVYPDAMGNDRGTPVFESSEEVSKAWQKMLQDISSFLRKKEEMRQININIFQRVYFNKDGKVDYYLYKIINLAELTEEQVQQVADLLNEFVKDYQFSLSADKGFVQCGRAKLVSECPSPKEKSESID